jgi:hypothetical protein
MGGGNFKCYLERVEIYELLRCLQSSTEDSSRNLDPSLGYRGGRRLPDGHGWDGDLLDLWRHRHPRRRRRDGNLADDLLLVRGHVCLRNGRHLVGLRRVTKFEIEIGTGLILVYCIVL